MMMSTDIVAPDGTLIGYVMFDEMYPEDRSRITVLICQRPNDERSKYKVNTFELSREGFIYIGLVHEKVIDE